MNVLIACEFSGIVREAFAARGHNAWSCDLLPSEQVGKHIQDSVLEYLDCNWDLMIAHPDCTYLANSGVQWLHRDPLRFFDLEDAAKFFNCLLDAPIPKIVVENPIQHKYARNLIRKYDQIVQPYYFGDAETKTTCLWLKNLPHLIATNSVVATDTARTGFSRVARESPSVDRWKNRSRTYRGLAEAMAEQWGIL